MASFTGLIRERCLESRRPPVIILEEMRLHRYERSGMRILPGVIAPSEFESGCREMYDFVIKMASL